MQFKQDTIVGIVIGVLIVAGVTSVFILYPIAQQQELPIIEPAPEFTLVNQDNESVSLTDLEGRVIMLGFIYTLCEDEFCPTMTYDFLVIQNELGDSFGSEVVLVCITLDPLHDTPAVLKSYSESWGANTSGWEFLTAFDLSTIEKVVDDYGVLSYANELDDLANVTDDNTTISMKISHENDTNSRLLIHSWVSMLIDQNLMIRRVYTKVSWIRLAAIKDIKSLL
ncbi:MAG: SCO family protein [Candidatus Hodarchaeales archaeon]|jgi:cytochrome oxidase Cu insertion factor (SCO1/SenC/PrrC family)